MSIQQATRHHFECLSREEQIAAVYRLADSGYSDYAISAATKWHVELIRQILGERRKA